MMDTPETESSPGALGNSAERLQDMFTTAAALGKRIMVDTVGGKSIPGRVVHTVFARSGEIIGIKTSENDVDGKSDPDNVEVSIVVSELNPTDFLEVQQADSFHPEFRRVINNTLGCISLGWLKSDKDSDN